MYGHGNVWGEKHRVNSGKTYGILSYSDIYAQGYKHVGNKMNKEKSCGEQYPCMGMHLRWSVMHREGIL